MKKLGIALALTLVFAPTALAQQGPNENANQNATVKQCKNMKAQMGKRNFNAAFAPKTWNARAAMRNCARKEAAAQQQARVNAAHACKAWAAGGDAPAGFEGAFPFTGPNAHGKCVSTVAKAQNQERRAATVNAAHVCKPGRTNPDHLVLEGTDNERAFSTFGPGKNAYGKCVSFVAKALQADEEEASTP